MPVCRFIFKRGGWPGFLPGICNCIRKPECRIFRAASRTAGIACRNKSTTRQPISLLICATAARQVMRNFRKFKSLHVGCIECGKYLHTVQATGSIEIARVKRHSILTKAVWALEPPSREESSARSTSSLARHNYNLT